MRLVQQGVLGAGAFDDVGRPTGVFLNAEGTILAVAGHFSGRQWHGRDVWDGRQLTHRVSVYEAASLRRIAFLDRVRHPINYVAFHPRCPILAIAAGSYDGGYTYGGELILWDFESGGSVSLLAGSREVVTCRFDDESDALHLTLRPPIDENFWDAERRVNIYPWRGEGLPPQPKKYMRLDTAIPAAAWQRMGERSVDPDTLPTRFTQVANALEMYKRQMAEEIAATLTHFALGAGQRYTPRWDVWDVAWGADDRLLAVRNQTALECWSLEGTLDWHIPDEMNGVQLLLAPDGEYAYVNMHGGRKRDEEFAKFARTSIVRIWLGSGAVEQLSGIDAPVMLSIARTGHLLARDTAREWYRREEPTLDRIIASDLTVSGPLDLGGYDLFNHYLRIDGADHLYFLQGTPPRTHWEEKPRRRASERKWVCRIEPDTGQVERLFPLEWDSERAGHLFGGAGCYVCDARGEGLILAGSLHRAERHHLIVRRALGDGEALWMVPCESQVTAIAYLPQPEIVVFALTGGQLGAIDAQTGALLDRQQVVAGATGAVPLSLAGRGNRIAAGLVDGRIALYEWC
ncbi:MAG: hypothetical protein U0841_23675 [Chloroflexia bacterium]